ncbi:MAG: type IV secretory system conjugative DNA transfer family protein [Candidatus Competibacter sp.]
MEAGDKWWSWFGLLAGKLKERAWLRWILQNWNEIIGWYCYFAVGMTVWLAVWDLLFEPHSFTAQGLTFRAGGWLGFLTALAWVVFKGAGAPLVIVAVVLSPVLVIVFTVGGALWLLGLFLGSVALVGFGPFVVLFGGRALFISKLARWFGEADQREKEERGVMAALGMGDAPERSFDGKARLMGLEEFVKFVQKPHKGAKTLVGYFHEVHKVGFYYPTEKHVLIVAGTRGGKGRSLIIPNLWIYKGSVFVLDPKGENAQLTKHERIKLGPVFAIDPFGVSGLPSARFNPLRYLVGPSMITDAQTLADALIIGDDHFASSARQLLVGLMLYVVTEPALTVPDYGGPVGRDLITVRRLLMRNLKATLESMVTNKAESLEVKTIIADIGAWGKATADDEWSGIKNSAIEQTKWLNSPEMCAVLEDGGTQVDFADYLAGVMSVYVCLPAPYFATFDKWLRLVVAAALDALTKRLAPPPLPVRFVLDEVAQLGNLSKIESALTLSAGYGVQLWGIWQHLKDIERCYPRSGVGGWVSSSGLRLVFAVQDNETIRYFATATGDAMTETDIRHLPPGKLLCMVDGANPLLVDRYQWPDEKKQEPKEGQDAQAAA